MDKDQLKADCESRYKELFGEVNTKSGYSVAAIICRGGGVLVLKSYSRNDFHSELEDKVLFAANKKIYRNNKEVGTHTIDVPDRPTMDSNRFQELWDKK